MAWPPGAHPSSQALLSQALTCPHLLIPVPTGPHLPILCSRVALGTSGTSYVASGKSGCISRCEGFLGIPLESLQENRASSRVEVENSGFISSCEGYLGELL